MRGVVTVGRHKQPRALAKLKGADRKNPQRYAKEELKVEGPLGEAPARMKGRSREFWEEIQKYALPGVLTPSDRLLLEIAANLMSEYTSRPRMFTATKYTHMIGILARLGMTPSDRQKFGVGKPPEEKDPFEEFENKSKPGKEVKRELNS